MHRRLLLLLLISLLRLQPSAQGLESTRFDRYTTTDGLSDNWVSGVAQDSTGYLWVATAWGFNRFNGHRFVQYHSSSDSVSLPAEEIWSLTWLDDHRLAAIGTGVHIVDTRTGETSNVFIPYADKKYQFKFNMVMGIKADAAGNLYVLSRSGFYQFDRQGKVVFRFDYYSGKDVPVNHFYFGERLFELDNERLLILSIGGLYTYHKQQMQLAKLSAADCPMLAEFLDYPRNNYQFFQPKRGVFFVAKTRCDSLVYVDMVHNKKVASPIPLHPSTAIIGWRSRMLQASDTLLYLSGHNAGVYSLRFHPESGAVNFSSKKDLENYLCLELAKDKSNRLLIATNKGLLRQREWMPATQTALLPAALQDSFPNLRLSEVYASANKVYAGSREGLLVFDKKSLRFEKLFTFAKADPMENNIRSLAPVSNENLLLGRDGAPLLFQLKNETTKPLLPPGWRTPGDWANDLCRDRGGNIWIGAENIYRYDTRNKNFSTLPPHPQLLEVPNAIEEDREGNVWIARHGLARYNTASARYDLYLDSFPCIKMADKQVKTIAFDDQNNVWFGNVNNGLVAYNLAKKTYRLFTRKDGLPDNDVIALIAIQDKIWIGCHSGLACIDTRTFKIHSFGRADGLPDSPVVNGARFHYDSVARQLYVGLSGNLVRFNPDNLLQAKAPPQTFVESVVIDGKRLLFLPAQNITTSWKDSELNIAVGGINFRDGLLQRFAYRIADDKDAAWVQIGSQPSFSISNLAPGKHRIQVKTFAADNRWPEQVKELFITVTPPFWLTTWFLALVSLGVLILLYWFIKWRINVVKRKEMVKTQIEKLKADDYKAQFELQQISHYFSTSLTDKKTEEEVLWDVAKNLIGRMNYEECVIYGWNQDRSRMVQKAAFGPKGKPEIIQASGFEVEPGQGIVGHVIVTKQPLLVKDTREDHRYRIDDDFRLSEITVPILHDGELLGVIDSEHHRVAYFTERDIKILTTIATLIGNKLKQLESEQSLEQKQQELAGINEQLAEARLSALQAQMNPHFVFNALNSIKRMILEEDNEKASRYLSKFALMIRMTLEHSKDVFVTLEENIRYIKAYLEMEQLRFGDSFSYHIHIGENMDATEVTIPSMMIQPLVENAIWHGLMHATGKKVVRIRFTEDDGKITCVVEDNGIGIRRSEKLKVANNAGHRSVGLENLRRRIKIMNEKYDTACSLELIDLAEAGKGSGTRAVLQLNLISV